MPNPFQRKLGGSRAAYSPLPRQTPTLKFLTDYQNSQFRDLLTPLPFLDRPLLPFQCTPSPANRLPISRHYNETPDSKKFRIEEQPEHALKSVPFRTVPMALPNPNQIWLPLSKILSNKIKQTNTPQLIANSSHEFLFNTFILLDSEGFQ